MCLIPVQCGARIVDRCDELKLRRYLNAPNATIVRAKKSGEIVRVVLSENGWTRARPDVPAGNSSTGMAFKQELSTGCVWALMGVTGSEREEVAAR